MASASAPTARCISIPGITLEAESNAADAYASADQALLMIEKRLRRYKSRLKDRSARKIACAVRGAVAALDAPSYVIEAPAPRTTMTHDDYNPVIIAEATTSLKRLSVSEAVMELDLTGAPVVVFLHGSQRPGEHHLPAAGRQYRLDRSAGGERLRSAQRSALTPAGPSLWSAASTARVPGTDPGVGTGCGAVWQADDLKAPNWDRALSPPPAHA